VTFLQPGVSELASKDNQKKFIKTVRKVLSDKYGEPKRRKERPPLDQLVQSLLWRYTLVKSGVRSFRSLKRHFVDWNEVRISTVAEISSAMSSAAWSRDCSVHLKEILQNLYHLRNVVKLDFLDDLTQPEATTFLRSLKGVSRDLADEVLLFNYGAKKIPLNADGARMCFRMGLFERDSASLKNQRVLADLLDEELHVGFTLFLHDHSRNICDSRRPKHKKCPMNDFCPREGLEE